MPPKCPWHARRSHTAGCPGLLAPALPHPAAGGGGSTLEVHPQPIHWSPHIVSTKCWATPPPPEESRKTLLKTNDPEFSKYWYVYMSTPPFLSQKDHHYPVNPPSLQEEPDFTANGQTVRATTSKNSVFLATDKARCVRLFLMGVSSTQPGWSAGG